MTQETLTVKDAFPELNANSTRVALRDGDREWTYSELNKRINQASAGLLSGRADLEEERIAFFMPASVDYVTTIMAIWRAGGIAVPLNIASAVPELEHALTCAQVSRLIVSSVTSSEAVEPLKQLCAKLNIEVLLIDDVLSDEEAVMPELSLERRAMILFTSGTTNKPKGVVTTHKGIRAQITTLLKAWGWQADDSIPLFLPLHHIHGIINVLCCGLWMGAKVTLFPKFDMPKILEQVQSGQYTVFMAVPTIYVKLIQHLESLDDAARTAITDGFKAMRLNISGSAACPVKLYNQWQDLTGQVLLERYGMTEIGMGLSNPYDGERRAGAVGVPLPSVQAQLFDEEHNIIEAEDTPGEIRIRGDNVFLEYWNNPEATAESFHEGWFCTGDVAVKENGYFRIMGRSSVDIIKSGGYKLSALEIEGTLLTHESIAECAVIGLEDETWGEAVTAFVVLKPGAELSYKDLKAWSESRMSPYKIPKALRVMEQLPRNAMGKVMKPKLKQL
ncbi:MAG: acyl-CoA synthetase [Pseudohongiellaceae bacterium]|nr:acyl-CoA synthetase [Pseudohongiellaceae bacterium]